MMKEKISDLLGIVCQEIGLYRDLLEHARKKTALLVQGHVETILESNKIEEMLNARLRTLETEMACLCRDLGQAFQIPRKEFTLMKLADSLEQSLALEVKSQAALFRNIVRQLKSVNQRNMRLIEKSVRYSEGLLALISNATSSYQPTGLFESIPKIQPTFSQRA
jgi:flagellar biosynthesis/type III secretory pathway chaperone